MNAPAPAPEPLLTTSDIGCAAALIAAGHELVNLDYSRPPRALFQFNPDASEDRDRYLRNDLKVDAQTMHHTVRRLKGQIFDLKEDRRANRQTH